MGVVEFEEEDGGVMVLLERDTWLIVAGEEAVRVTIVTGMAMIGCVETVEGVEVAVLFGRTDKALPSKKKKYYFNIL